MNETRNIMCENVITILCDDSIVHAYQIMKEKNIRHLPVVDSFGSLSGMLSDRDVQKAMITKKLSEYHNDVEIPSEFKVSNFMNWPVSTVSEGTHIKKVAEIMLKEKISSIVVEGAYGNIRGIVTTTDLLEYLLHTISDVEKNHNYTQWTLAYYLNRKQ